jgi:hypothetical protein
MDSRLYPQGRGGVVSRYIDGVLYFYNSDGAEVYHIDPANRKLVVPSGATFENAGTSSFTGAQTYDDIIVTAFLRASDDATVRLGSDADVTMAWISASSVVSVLPVTDDTGSFNFGNGTKDIDIKAFLGTANDYVLFNVGNKALEIFGDVRLDFTGATSAAGNTDGSLIKGGASNAKLIQSVADNKFISFYLDNAATSGDSRGLYLRQYISGAGGGGDAARFYSTVNDVAAATVRGAHISLDFGASGTVTGLGAALECTLHIPNDATQAGTLCAIKLAVNSDGSTSDPAGSALSFIRVDNQGDATGMADVDTDAYLFDLAGFTEASGSMVSIQSAGAYPAGLVGTLKIRVGGVAYYIPLQNVEAN